MFAQSREQSTKRIRRSKYARIGNNRLNKMDLMLIEEVTCFALRDMEIKQEKGERIEKQKEFDLRMLRRKIGLIRMQEK